MLRLQQYERLLKAMVSHGESQGSITDLDKLRDRRVADTGRKTLGVLIGELPGTQVVSQDSDSPLEAPDMPGKVASFAFRLQLRLSAEEYQRTENELRELVHLRNGLVHHFIDQHDLWTAEGCRDAQQALIAAFDRIERHYGQLMDWAASLETTRQQFAVLLRSDAVRHVVITGLEMGKDQN